MALNGVLDSAVRHARSRLPAGESLTHYEGCEAPIPEARRAALPEVRLCTLCQGGRDEARCEGYNRRGSKDSLLR